MEGLRWRRGMNRGAFDCWPWQDRVIEVAVVPREDSLDYTYDDMKKNTNHKHAIFSLYSQTTDDFIHRQQLHIEAH